MAERRPPKVAPPRPRAPQAARRPERPSPNPPEQAKAAKTGSDAVRRAVRPVRSHADATVSRARPVAPSTDRSAASKAPASARVATPRPPGDTVSHRMSERLAERKRTERRRVLSRVGRWGALAAGVAVLLWAFFMSPVFELDPAKIQLAGVADKIDPAAVNEVLASYEGESLALLNVPHVADQLRDLTGVRDATVERVWPAGLRVTLVPRHPVAAIPDGAGFALLDAEAIQVGTAEQAPVDLPIVTVPLGDERILAAVLEVIRNLPADLLGRVSGVGAQTEDTVTFTLRDGPRVDWGSSEDSALKAQVLEVMLASASASTAAVIDVSAPTLPITRLDG